LLAPTQLTKFTVVAGSAAGPSRLNAFDNALLAAGIGNLNLVRISSILPPGCRPAERIAVAPGSLVPTAYAAIISEVPGEQIAAAVAVGMGAPDEYGVIMEFSGTCSRQEAEERVRAMVEAAFLSRGRRLLEVVAAAAEHRVAADPGIGCAMAAVALWD
jgi:arginine decarboxylase